VDAGAPRASIVLFAGREIEFVRAGDGHVLRSSETVLARIDGDVAVTADGRWTLSNPRGVTLDVRRDGSQEVIARYRSGIAGGTIQVSGGATYTLRGPVLGEAWKLRARRSRRLVASVVPRGAYDVTLADGAAAAPDLGLVLLVALRAMLLEEAMPSGHAPVTGGY
jgi:hypothetical protein